MESRILDSLLPCLGGDPVDVALLADDRATGDALLGLPDWFAALAQQRQAVRRFASSVDETGPVLELVPMAQGPAATLLALGPGRYRLAWTEPAAATALARSLAVAQVPAGAYSVTWSPGGLHVQLASGGEVSLRPEEQEEKPPVALTDILSLIPGQGGMPSGVSVPQDVAADWVLAFTAYAVRLAVSCEGPLPLPLLVPAAAGHGGPLLDRYADTIWMGPDGRLRLPGWKAGVEILRAMAALPTYPERPIRLHRIAPPRAADEAIYERSWEIPWEGDRLLASLAGLLKETAAPPGRIELFASETLALRQDIARKAQLILKEHGLQDTELLLRSGYKQAYHWASEEVLPRLSALGAVDVELRVPRFSGAADEIGDACSWVAGLAPADELVAAALGLSGESVRLMLHDAPCYSVQACEAKGTVLLEDRFTPLLTRMELGEIYPGKAAVVETGGIRLLAEDGSVIAETLVETDSEAAFRSFMAGLLELRPILEASTGLPLFGRLEATVSLSEPDEDLPVPWERFSPAEELHEEIYFGAIAAFEPLTKARGSGNIRAPGAIVPRVRVVEGGPTRLELRVTGAGDALRPLASVPLRLREIAWRHGRLEAVPEGDLPEGYGVPPGQLPTGLFLTAGSVEDLNAPLAPPLAAELPYRPEAAWALSRAAAAEAGALAWVEGYSYMGREIPAIAWCPGTRGLVYSPRRMARSLPTLLVVAGHHANETSSTVSALRLVRGLRGEGPGAALLVVPMENPDGAAIHRELASENPRWKLHAARFNAVGHEFGRDSSESPFGEAYVRPALVEDFRVDVLVDDHGVPGHEWAQPFSGRSSPPLFPVAYTYPSGVFYGIGQGGVGDEGPGEDVLPFWQRVTARLDLDPELREAQALLWNRYERYGQRLCPDRYPSRRNLGWPFQSTRRATRRDAPRWPLEFVTEVADEGASPEQFELCVRAHLHADKAILEVLQGFPGKPPRTGGQGPGHA